MRFVVALFFSTFLVLSTQAHASPDEELDPSSPQIEEQLKQLDENYLLETGHSPFLEESDASLLSQDCYQASCPLYAHISKADQKLYLYVDGLIAYEWLVSTGTDGYTTPDFDTHPNGRIYDSYTSKKFPGVSYLDLGNMSYAVFISGGYAIHGTTPGSWPSLGTAASHGCIRLHPDNAFIFNRLVRQYGKRNTWITVK